MPRIIAALADATRALSGVEGNYYPGVRRVIGRADADADAYVERTCREAAQFIAGAFDVDGFDLVEASFSMVTTRAVANCGRRSARRISIRPIRSISRCCTICACRRAAELRSIASARRGSSG